MSFVEGNGTLFGILRQCLKDTGIIYLVNNKTIFVYHELFCFLIERTALRGAVITVWAILEQGKLLK